jgi:hypothetical protein
MAHRFNWCAPIILSTHDPFPVLMPNQSFDRANGRLRRSLARRSALTLGLFEIDACRGFLEAYKTPGYSSENSCFHGSW